MTVSAVGSGSTVDVAIPIDQRCIEMTQHLSNLIVRVNASIEEIMSQFSQDVTFLARIPYCLGFQQLKRDVVAEKFISPYCKSIKALGDWSDTFKVSPDKPNRLVWILNGLRYLEGEKLPKGWQRVKQTIEFEFTEEEKVLPPLLEVSEGSSTPPKINELKISIMQITSNKIVNLDTDRIRSLPPTQVTARELAFRSFQIPQQSDALCALYDPSARILYPSGEEKDMTEFKEYMIQSNTINVVALGTLTNTFRPVKGKENVIEWIVQVTQERLGLGAGEEGIPGTFEIHQVAHLTIAPNGQILVQDIKKYQKDRLPPFAE